MENDLFTTEHVLVEWRSQEFLQNLLLKPGKPISQVKTHMFAVIDVSELGAKHVPVFNFLLVYIKLKTGPPFINHSFLAKTSLHKMKNVQMINNIFDVHVIILVPGVATPLKLIGLPDVADFFAEPNVGIVFEADKSSKSVTTTILPLNHFLCLDSAILGLWSNSAQLCLLRLPLSPPKRGQAQPQLPH